MSSFVAYSWPLTFGDPSAMRWHLVIVVTVSLGCGGTAAQADPPPAAPVVLTKADLPPLRLLPSANPAMVVSPHRVSAGSPQSRQEIHDRDIADCLQMWDSGTHMTKQEWANTCRRVQTRLDNLKVDATMPKTKVR
jgi:hypothetical protein